VIYVIAELRLKPDLADRVADEARKVVAGTVKEDGCLQYDFHVSVTDPTRLVAVERWTSREALEAHGRASHLLTWRAVLKGNVVEQNIQIITPERVDRL
jgi:quinol monooxygenase YgiN